MRLVLTNAKLIDGEEGPHARATVVIQDERIEAVTSGRPFARGPDDTVIDLRGCTVMPGMFNCHYHVSYLNVGKGSPLPVGMDAPPGLQTIRAARHLAMALDAGFTGVISAGAPYAIDASLKAAVEEGTIPGPRIMAGSRDVSTTGHSQDLYYPWYWGEVNTPGVARCDGPEEFRKAVRMEIKRGAEIIKIFATGGHGVAGVPEKLDVSREEMAAAIETAHERDARVRAHIANRRGIVTALDCGIDVVDHGDGLDEELVERMVQSGTFLAPSMLYPYRVAQVRGGPAVERMKAGMDKMMEILPLANKAGVKLVLGDDFGAGPLPHGDYAAELDFYVNVAGIPARDVLLWATVNGAEMMGRGHELGAVRAGALADLVVVDGDPVADVRILSDKTKLLAVLKGGSFARNDLAVLEARGGVERSVA